MPSLPQRMINGPKRYFGRLVDQFGWRFVALAAGVYGVNQAIGEGWGGFATNYLFSDEPPIGLGLDAAQAGAIGGLTNIPWQIKSLYGIMSDAVPINGYHRTSYLVICSILGVFAWIALGILPLNVFIASAFLILSNLAIASPDVMVDASVAEKCKQYPALASDLQSLCWGSYGVGAIFSSLTAGWLYQDILGSRGLFALTSLTSMVVLIPSYNGWLGEEKDPQASTKLKLLSDQIESSKCGRCLSASGCLVLCGTIKEYICCCCSKSITASENDRGSRLPLARSQLPSEHVNSNGSIQQEISEADVIGGVRSEAPTSSTPGRHSGKSKDAHNKNLFILAFALCAISIFVGTTVSYFANPTFQGCAYVLAVISVCTLVYRLECPISTKLAKASLYIFLQGAVQPSSSVIFYWSRENADNCDVVREPLRPCFSPEFLSMIEVVGYVFFVLGTAAYNTCLSKMSYQRIWTLTQLALIPLNLLDFMWVMRYNLDIGISDVAFTLGDEVVGHMISRINTMPMFILAAKLCPKGYEATLFAMTMGLSNFGRVMGSYLGTIGLGVLGTHKPEFHNLGTFVFIRSLTRVIPIFMIPFLVPAGSPHDETDILDDDDSDDIDGNEQDNDTDFTDPVLPRTGHIYSHGRTDLAPLLSEREISEEEEQGAGDIQMQDMSLGRI